MDNQFSELLIKASPYIYGFLPMKDLEGKNLDLRLANMSKFWKCKAEIEKKASQGFKYAKKLEKSMGYFKPGMVALEKLMSLPTTAAASERENLEREIIHLFAGVYKTTEIITCYDTKSFTAFHEVVLGMADKLSGSNNFGSDLKLDVRVCFAFFMLSSAPESVTEIAEICIRMYPQELFFHSVRCNSLGFAGKFKEGLKAAQKSLKVIPNDCELLFTVVSAIRRILEEEKILTKAKLETCTAAHVEFLKHAPLDHRYTPEIYYSLAYMCITKINMHPTRIGSDMLHTQVKQYYQSGLQSEQYLLSCFLPYERYDKKSLVESYLQVCTVISPEYNRMQLTGLKRVDKIQAHRQFVYDSKLEKFSKLQIDEKYQEEENGTIKKNVLLGNLKMKNQQVVDQEPDKLEPIELWDMNRSKDRIYEGRCINLTIIEDAVIGSLEYVQTLVQDANGEVESCILYGLDQQDPFLQERLGYGSSITVMNPHMHLPLDFYAKTCIKVDDPGNVVCHLEEKLEKRCRSCGHDGALQRCGNCKRVKYCNKKCQTQDWKILKHKLVCNQ